MRSMEGSKTGFRSLKRVFRHRCARVVVMIIVAVAILVLLRGSRNKMYQAAENVLARVQYPQAERSTSPPPPVKSGLEEMVKDIRTHFLEPPSKKPYSLSEPDVRDPSMGQSNVVLDLLKSQRNGFFVECGALDGETRSNTLYMERFLNWTGLLVEADPSNFRMLQTKQRKAWATNVCLNDRLEKSTVRFKPAFNMGKIFETSPNSSKEEGSLVWDQILTWYPSHTDVVCFPLHAVLKALDRSRVDYFSLDVEGAELKVLKTIPFDKLDIRVLSVEFTHTGREGKEDIRRLMEANGYAVVGEVTHFDLLANDLMFVKRGVQFEGLLKDLNDGRWSGSRKDWVPS